MLFIDSFDVKCCFMSLRNFFTARVYAKLLQNDPYGRISNMQFFNYVMRKGVELWICAELRVSPDAGSLILICPPPFPVWLHQTRIGLSLYDVAGQGYLRELVSAVLFFSQKSLCSDCRLTLVA